MSAAVYGSAVVVDAVANALFAVGSAGAKLLTKHYLERQYSLRHLMLYHCVTALGL